MGFLDSIGGSLALGPVWGSVLGGGGGGDPGKKRLKQIEALYAQIAAQQNQAYGNAEIEQKKAVGNINTGYGNALANSSLVANNAKNNVTQQGQQSLASMTQSLASRGLYNTTAFDAAKRGVAADTQKSLSGIDAALAQLQGGLQVGQGQALAGANAGMAAFYQNQSAAQTGLGLSHIGTLAGVQDQNTDWLGQLIGTGAQMLPFFL